MSPQDIRQMQHPPGSADDAKTKPADYGRAAGTSPLWLTATKWLLIGFSLVVLAIVVQKTIAGGAWIGVVVAAFIAMCVLVVYGTRRSVPLKYLLPGLLLLVGLQI